VTERGIQLRMINQLLSEWLISSSLQCAHQRGAMFRELENRRGTIGTIYGRCCCWQSEEILNQEEVTMNSATIKEFIGKVWLKYSIFLGCPHWYLSDIQHTSLDNRRSDPQCKIKFHQMNDLSLFRKRKLNMYRQLRLPRN
jgi:hypothetical protein